MSDNPFLWYYGPDEEVMRLLHDKPMTLEEAQADLQSVLQDEEYEPGRTVYLVEANKATPGKFDAEDLLECWLVNNEECWGEDWPDIATDVVADLQAHLDVWMLANAHRLPPSWCFGATRQRHENVVPEPEEVKS